MKITTIMINTNDPDRLVDFWKTFLGVEENFRVNNFVWLKATEGQPAIGFQKVEDTGTQPQRIHFDILVDDKSETTKRIIELGGKQISKDNINNIVADPAGNQFCVYEQKDNV